MRILLATFFFFSAIFATGTPQRIISLSPNATTILVDLGVQGELVGVTRYCTPAAGTSPTVIGGFIDPSAETILALKPDLLIRANTSDKSFLLRMKRHGINFVLLNPESYENVKKDIELLGKTTGREKRAQEILAKWQKTEEQIKTTLRERPLKKTPKVLIRWGEVFVGKSAFLNDAIEICGGENCVPESKRAWPILTKETLITTGAQLLICVTPTAPETLTRDPALAKKLSTLPAYSHLPAIISGNVWSIRESQALYPASQLYKILPALADAIRNSAN